MHYIYINNS